MFQFKSFLIVFTISLLIICSIYIRNNNLFPSSSSSSSSHAKLRDLSISELSLKKRGLQNKFSIENLNKAIEAAQQSLSTIYNRYQLNENIGKSFFFISQNIDEKSYNFLKYQYARKFTNPGSEYLMIFGGSSVTAGHDNLYTQSYPEVIGRKLRPVLEALNVSTVVHNIAQGANNCFPSNYCYESMGGYDPDFVGWEQSFNCGRAPEFFDISTRFALWSKNPGIIYFSQSGSVNGGKSCDASKVDPPRCREPWTPSLESLPDWKPTKDDVKFWVSELHRSFKELGSTASRFAGAPVAYQQKGAPIAYSGSAVWEDRDDKYCLNTGVPTKKCNVGYFLETCNFLKFVTKELAEYGTGHGANWHPTVGTHLYRGELIAWMLLLTILDSLYMIKDDIEAGVILTANLHQKYTDKYESLYTLKSMPDPQTCGAASSLKSCATKPNCFTDYHPHYAKNLSLSELIVGNTSWEKILPDLLGAPIPDQEHIEGRPGYTATHGPRSGEIYFKVKIGQHDKMVVCAYHVPNLYASSEFHIELNVPEERLNSNYKPGPDRKLWTHVSSVDGCSGLSNLPPGTHVVGLSSKINESKSQAGLSHIITWN